MGRLVLHVAPARSQRAESEAQLSGVPGVADRVPFLGHLKHPGNRILADVARGGRSVATHLVAFVQGQGGHSRELLCLQDGGELVHTPLV